MANRMIGTKPLSNAEKQRRYRARQKAKATAMLLFSEKPAQDVNALRKSIKQELRASWELELKEERMAVERKTGSGTCHAKRQESGTWPHRGDMQRRCFFIGRDRG